MQVLVFVKINLDKNDFSCAKICGSAVCFVLHSFGVLAFVLCCTFHVVLIV